MESIRTYYAQIWILYNLDIVTIGFKKLKEGDLQLMFKWLNTQHVVEWYEKKKSTYGEVKAKYIPRITGKEPTKPFLITVDQVPIGYIQEYYINDDPDLKPYVNGNFAGLDLFIGDSAYLNRGLGTQILREFLKQVVFQEKDIEGCLVDPSPDNARMIRVDEKVGFVYLATTTGPDPKYLMTIHRDEFKI